MNSSIKKLAFAPITFAAIICAIFLIDVLLPIDFNRFGIRPRSFSGLFGIPISPFLHGDLSHLFSNLPPLLALGFLMRTYGQRFFLVSTIVLIILSGLLTWILSSSGIVIGASSLIFAYWSFLVTVGVRLKTTKTILIAIVTLFLYGGLILGLGNFAAGISWAGHFSGAVAGFILAFLMPPPQS
ncbi:MAG: rhomboid family intramembrane serine protease [Acidiferrobacterales bacterium]|nr:rhomboid family intramembrane serine protease [Acidiferrobacterales bacterium]